MNHKWDIIHSLTPLDLKLIVNAPGQISPYLIEFMCLCAVYDLLDTIP